MNHLPIPCACARRNDQGWQLKNHESQAGGATVQLNFNLSWEKGAVKFNEARGWGILVGLTQPQGRSMTFDEALWWFGIFLVVVVGFGFFFFSPPRWKEDWFPQNSCWMDRALHGAEQGHSGGGSGDTCATQLLCLRFPLALSFTCSSGRSRNWDSPWRGFCLWSEEGLRGPFLCTSQHANTTEQFQLPGGSPEHQELSHRRA